MQKVIKAPVTKQAIIQCVVDHPGITPPEVAERLGTTPGNASNQLLRIFKGEGGGANLVREKFRKSPTVETFRWYHVEAAPVDVAIEIRPGEIVMMKSPDNEPRPVAQVAEQAPTATGTSVQDMVRYVGEHPGASAQDIGDALGIPAQDVASRIYNFYSRKKGQGELDRMEDRRGGRLIFRWYHPKDLPEAERQRRAEAERLRQEEQNRLDAQRAEEERIRAALEPAISEAPEESPPAETVPFPAVPAQVAQAAPKPSALDALLDQIGGAIAAQIVEAIRAHLAVELPTLVPESRPAAPPLPDLSRLFSQVKAEQKPAREKIVICGLLPAQAGAVSAKYGEYFDLSFWKDDNPDTLKQWVKSADYVLIHIKHSGHNCERLVKSVGGGGDKVRRINGASSAICDWLLNRMREIQAERHKSGA